MKKCVILLGVIFLVICLAHCSTKTDNVTDNDDFDLQIMLDKTRYQFGEGIEAHAKLTYIGDKESIQVTHGDPMLWIGLSGDSDLMEDVLIHAVEIRSRLDKNVIYTYDAANIYFIDANARIEKYADNTIKIFLPEGKYAAYACLRCTEAESNRLIEKMSTVNFEVK